MMSGENIICFAKDWEEDPTSNNHVMIELAKGNRVLWLNSIATRTPSLTSGRDVGKIFRKLASFLRGAKVVRPNLFVFTPIVLPFPHNRIARKLNPLILRASIRWLRWRLKMRQFQLWTFLPSTADYLGAMGESVSVYYCVDEWSKFSYVDGPRIQIAERALCQRADLIFVTAQSMIDSRRSLNPQTHLARHGVDHDHFARALDADLEVPADVRGLQPPIVGFYGTIQDWVDLDLLEHLARNRPEWSIVLIGQARVDVSRLRALPNVHILGRKRHDELPAYCKAFSVGLIPQKVNELTLHMNPIKLREYLSAGLPVVATALPEVQAYHEHCRVANDYAQFEALVANEITKDSPEARRARSDAMRSETWARKVEVVCDNVMRAKEDRCRMTA